MPSIKVFQIIDDVARQLLDDDNERWTREELNTWLNEAQRVTVVLKPNAGALNTNIRLVPGTKQALPVDGVSLLKITRNMGADGNTPGRTISIVDQQSIDTLNPDWHTDDADNSVENYVYDAQNDPKTFYVYPPQPSADMGYIELVYSAIPADVTDDKQADPPTATISIADEYEPAIKNYMLYRTYAKDGDTPTGSAKAGAYWDLFLQILGVKEAKEVQFDPNVVVGIK
jgi:hypothetical protein